MNVRRQATKPADRQSSRARLVQAASDLLRRQGYATTVVKEIAREADAPMGSFYFHFPDGKEELAAEAMNHGADEFREVLVEALSSSDDLATAYARTATLIAERLEVNEWTMGCPVATTALETMTASSTLQAAAQSAFTSWRRTLAERAERAGVGEAEADTLASNALALIEGAELLARIERSPVPLTRAATALHAMAETAAEHGQRRG